MNFTPSLRNKKNHLVRIKKDAVTYAGGTWNEYSKERVGEEVEGWRMGSERGLPRYHLVETSSKALIGITSIATIRSATARLAIR